jgi:opacity protein-like surface antigen
VIVSKRLFISTLTTLLISASAEGFAADMAVKAPPVVAPLPPAWAGFYFGGNVGYGWSQKEFFDNFSPPIGAEDGSVTANGVVGGIQGGYKLSDRCIPARDRRRLYLVGSKRYFFVLSVARAPDVYG